MGIWLATGLLTLASCAPITLGSSGAKAPDPAQLGSTSPSASPSQPDTHFAGNAPVDSSQSTALTNYLHSRQLPLVGARVLASNGGPRQAILYGRRLDCDSPEGRLVCDEVVPPDQLDAAIEQIVEGFTSSGVVSAAGNRRAIRVGQEPLDLFRRYMAVYAREQAQCHFSPALIANLERNWSAQQRRP